MNYAKQEQQDVINNFRYEIKPILDIKLNLLRTAVILCFKDGQFIYNCQAELDKTDSMLNLKQKYYQSLLDEHNHNNTSISNSIK